LPFEVTSFNIGYNCILGRPFLLKFRVVIHTAYATIKMPDPKGVIIIKADQRDALVCEKAAQEQVAKAAKIKGGSMSSKTLVSKPLIGNSPRTPPSSKDTNIASASIPMPTNQKVDHKLKGTLETEDQQVPVDLNNLDKKLLFNDNLDPK
jgi:hypothetical protein